MVDEEYKRFVEELIEISDTVIEDRKDLWNEYEVFKKRIYCIELKLSNDEYIKYVQYKH